MKRVIFAILCLNLCGLAARADSVMPIERQRELLNEGLNNFDQAMEQAAQHTGDPDALYRRSVGAFETLASGGVRSPALEYNLGNTYFRLGELGKAIVHYRRGLRLAPTDFDLNENLNYTRNRVEPFIQPTGTQRLLERLLFWTNRTSVAERYRMTLYASIAGWLGLLIRLRYRARPLLVISCLVIVFALANAGSIAWQIHEEHSKPPAVVVNGQHILRLGRGEGYDPALNQPLGPGVEVRILSERADWAEIQLADGKTGWLPSSAIERI